jgi:glycosyltransferase involved in cell wall biosynthesis
MSGSLLAMDFDSISAGKIYMFGWRGEDEMRAIMERSDYALVPSRFVETFGLSALESLRVGIPAIGPRVGGLAAFVPPELSIDLDRPVIETAERIRAMLEGRVGLDEEASRRREAIVAAHSRESWLASATGRVLGPEAKKILMVSDYAAPIGGVERHMETIGEVLEGAGYEVRIFGKTPRSIPLAKREKITDMLGTFTRGWGYRELRRELADFAPDAVWVHSLTKVYDARTVSLLADYSGRKIFTYHDFSLFSAFASRMRSLADAPTEWTYADYIATLDRPSLFERAYLRLKFSKISSIQRKLARFDEHVVPSEFMVPFVERFIGMPPERVTILPHFLSPRSPQLLP